MIGRRNKRAEPVRSFSADLAKHGGAGQRHLGMRSVAVGQIVGSVGRARELGSDFLPLQKTWGFSRDTARYRWVRKAMAQAESFDLDDMHHVTGRYYSHGDYRAKKGTPLPPIELYKLGDAYYVVDGHHRVAAALSLGQVEMEAIVTEYMPSNAMQASTAA